MRGNPVIRLTLVLFGLALTSVVVATVTRPVPPSDRLAGSQPESDLPFREHDPEAVEAYAEYTLSSPARSLTWLASERGDPPLFRIEPEALTGEIEFALPLRAGRAGGTELRVEWRDPTRSNFLHLSVEPHRLPTKEATLHFPPGSSSARLPLHWDSD